jgi:hypothetical protein
MRSRWDRGAQPRSHRLIFEAPLCVDRRGVVWGCWCGWLVVFRSFLRLRAWFAGSAGGAVVGWWSGLSRRLMVWVGGGVYCGSQRRQSRAPPAAPARRAASALRDHKTPPRWRSECWSPLSRIPHLWRGRGPLGEAQRRPGGGHQGAAIRDKGDHKQRPSAASATPHPRSEAARRAGAAGGACKTLTLPLPVTLALDCGLRTDHLPTPPPRRKTSGTSDPRHQRIPQTMREAVKKRLCLSTHKQTRTRPHIPPGASGAPLIPRPQTQPHPRAARPPASRSPRAPSWTSPRICASRT